jgi:hypothetical protein
MKISKIGSRPGIVTGDQMGCMIFSTGVSESYERTLNTLYLTLLNQRRKNNSISYLPDHAILPDTILSNRQILPADSSPPSPFASTRSRACAPRLTRCLGPRRKLSCPHIVDKSHESIHACPNNCVLFWKDYEKINECPVVHQDG